MEEMNEREEERMKKKEWMNKTKDGKCERKKKKHGKYEWKKERKHEERKPEDMEGK